MDKEKKNLIVFGYGLAVILGFFSFKIWHDHGWVAVHIILLACISVLVAITLLRYKLLKSFYTQWMKGAHFIGNIITCLVLSILFYFVFGIVGIILRLLKKDLLDQRMNYAADSYWIKKEQIDFNQSHYTRQFSQL